MQVIVAGALGVRSAALNASRCMVRLHFPRVTFEKDFFQSLNKKYSEKPLIQINTMPNFCGYTLQMYHWCKAVSNTVLNVVFQGLTFYKKCTVIRLISSLSCFFCMHFCHMQVIRVFFTVMGNFVALLLTNF